MNCDIARLADIERKRNLGTPPTIYERNFLIRLAREAVDARKEVVALELDTPEIVAE